MSEDKIYPSMVIRSQAEVIELLEQENKQLKDKLEFYSGLELDKTIDKTRLEYNKLQQENKQLKEVIEEAMEYIEKTPIGSILEVHCGYEEEYTKPLLQILDKAKENK